MDNRPGYPTLTPTISDGLGVVVQCADKDLEDALVASLRQQQYRVNGSTPTGQEPSFFQVATNQVSASTIVIDSLNTAFAGVFPQDGAARKQEHSEKRRAKLRAKRLRKSASGK